MSEESGTQFDNTSVTLVMRRFFEALKTENLMAAELWANHPRFNRAESDHVNYMRTFNNLFLGEDGLQLTWITIEWLLAHAVSLRDSKTITGAHALFCPGSEYTGRRRGSHNWRWWIVYRGAKKWQEKPDELLATPERLRMYKNVLLLGWTDAPREWLKTNVGRTLLLQCLHPAKLLKWATHIDRDYNYQTHKYVSRPMEMDMINALFATHGQFDVSQIGDELVREYSREDDDGAGRKLALRLLKHRDTGQPMPEEFTKFVQETVTAYKLYQKLQEDQHILKGAKTDE